MRRVAGQRKHTNRQSGRQAAEREREFYSEKTWTGEFLRCCTDRRTHARTQAHRRTDGRTDGRTSRTSRTSRTVALLDGVFLSWFVCARSLAGQDAAGATTSRVARRGGQPTCAQKVPERRLCRANEQQQGGGAGRGGTRASLCGTALRTSAFPVHAHICIEFAVLAGLSGWLARGVDGGLCFGEAQLRRAPVSGLFVCKKQLLKQTSGQLLLCW